MRATRRNVLVILGVLTIAGGALFGTGAFTQVEAQRSVDVDTQGDAEAQLGLNITNDDLAAGGSSDTIEFEESDLNLNATTRYNESFEVSNNDPDTTIGEVRIEDSDGNSLVDATGEVMYFEQVDGSTDLTDGDSITYDVVFDTNNGDISEVPDEITIVANEA